MCYTRAICKLAVIWFFLASVTGSAAVFTFENIPLNMETPFDDTADGITASFTSPDAAAFSIGPGLLFRTLSGQVLQEVPGPAAQTLEIAFNTPLQSIALLFALNGDPSDTLTLEAWLGTEFTGSESAFGAIPPTGILPEGTLAFSAGIFNTVRLMSTAPDFAIDSVNVSRASTTIIPEPAPLILTFAGLAALLTAGRRRLSS